MTVLEMLRTHPGETFLDDEQLARGVDEIVRCATTCRSCADACLGEPDVGDLVRCIRLNLDCADVCDATAAVLIRQTAFDPALARPVLDACIAACGACGDECERHASHHEHCRSCAEACRACRSICEELLSSMR